MAELTEEKKMELNERIEEGRKYYRYSCLDLFMLPIRNGKIVCWQCKLRRKNFRDIHKNTVLSSKKEALEHLKEHLLVHEVPSYVMERLKEDIENE